MPAKILILKDFWCFHHVVDQWDRSLSEHCFNNSLVVKVEINNVEVDSPHSLTYLLLIVKQLSNAGKSFVSSLANLSMRADNPLKTMNDKPGMDTVSNASDAAKSISGQQISVPAMSGASSTEKDDKAVSGSQPAGGMSFQPISKYTR